MAKVWSGRRRASRALVTSVVAGLYVLQVFALLLALRGPSVASPGYSLAAAETLCQATTHSDGRGTIPPMRGRFCGMCPADCDASQTVVLPWRETTAADPGRGIGATQRPADTRVREASERAGSRSSRGPPRSC